LEIVRFWAFASAHLKSLLLFNVVWCFLVDSYWHFWVVCWSHLQGPRSPRTLPLKPGLTQCPEKSVTLYQTSPRHIPEEQIPQFRNALHISNKWPCLQLMHIFCTILQNNCHSLKYYMLYICFSRVTPKSGSCRATALTWIPRTKI
jgi:hypothetical protein